ncbi:MAG: epimerase [Polyangiaceae bacterium]|nr:epimerase [Polyangiaceae bacterium]
MNILLLGATGMIGQGVLGQCLLAPDVNGVTILGRSSTGVTHPKVKEILHSDFTNFSTVEQQLTGHDACFFCLGVSSSGMSEADYTHITYDYTLAFGTALSRVAPQTVFVYISGAGTDSTEKGRSMWARVKGKTENALLALPFEKAYMARPGYIQPLDGIRSKTGLYRAMYAAMGPLYPVWKRLAPGLVTNTREVGLALLQIARNGAPKRVLETSDLAALANQTTSAAQSHSQS